MRCPKPKRLQRRQEDEEKCQSQGNEKLQESVVLPLSQMLRKDEVG